MALSAAANFLSCLYGSEGVNVFESAADKFLSCLYGSEVDLIDRNRLLYKVVVEKSGHFPFPGVAAK